MGKKERNENNLYIALTPDFQHFFPERCQLLYKQAMLHHQVNSYSLFSKYCSMDKNKSGVGCEWGGGGNYFGTNPV
jgi:hypothetical protein